MRDVFGEEETQSFSNLPVNKHKKMLEDFLDSMSSQLHFSYGEEGKLDTLNDEEVMYIAIRDSD